MTIFRSLVVGMLMVASAFLAGCVAQDLPQEQAQRADRIGPLEVHIHADYNVFARSRKLAGASGASGGGAQELDASGAEDGRTPTTQPTNAATPNDAADRDGIATITHNTTTMTVHISTQGSSTQGQTATGGSPGPVSNTPSVSVPVSVSPMP
jgi:hypothetical protein